MNKNYFLLDFFYAVLFSEKVKKNCELTIVSIAIVSFILHLLIIALVDFEIVHLNDHSKLLSNPIAAIYTPFSFILIYEVYLLVYYLPKSTSNYIGKQYEIITLIVIRRIFKDLSKLEFNSNWFNIKYDLEFTYDLIATLLLFFLILLFNQLNKKELKVPDSNTSEIIKFIQLKKIIALFLIPIFLILSLFSLGRWIYESFFSISQMVYSIKDINKIFFDDFFTILILTDVLLLLFSFLHTNKFNKVIRNSGFIISTILIKLSFGTEGILNTILIVVAVLFGVLILLIHNKYEKLELIKME